VFEILDLQWNLHGRNAGVSRYDNFIVDARKIEFLVKLEEKSTDKSQEISTFLPS
jgi:hypothetical protein